MHRDIFLTNAPEVLRWIDAYTEELALLRQHIQDGDETELHAYLRSASRARQTWLDGSFDIGDDLITDEIQWSFGDQMQQLFLGGKGAQILREFRRKKKI